MEFVTNKFFFFLLFFGVACADSTKFLLVAGPSGVGKSTVIKELQKLDSRFVYIKPFTTRLLREGETDKLHMDLPEMLDLQEQGKLLALNHIHGNYYATPLTPIVEAMEADFFPVLDWPIVKVDLVRNLLNQRTVTIYLYVSQIEELSDRLSRDLRDSDGSRLTSGKVELDSFFLGRYDDLIDCRFDTSKITPPQLAEIIYRFYLEKLRI